MHELTHPFAECAIADLVVILHKVHERSGRQMRTGLTPRRPCMLRNLALVDKALGETAAQLGKRLRGEVEVITIGLARQDRVEAMVRVVIPLRIESVAAAGGPEKE